MTRDADDDVSCLTLHGHSTVTAIETALPYRTYLIHPSQVLLLTLGDVP